MSLLQSLTETHMLGCLPHVTTCCYSIDLHQTCISAYVRLQPTQFLWLSLRHVLLIQLPQAATVPVWHEVMLLMCNIIFSCGYACVYAQPFNASQVRHKQFIPN